MPNRPQTATIAACNAHERVMSGILQAAAATTQRELALRALRPDYAEVPVIPDKLGAIAAAIAVFDDHGIPYALIGGLAVGMRSGVPRATLDVDFATSVGRSSLLALFVQLG